MYNIPRQLKQRLQGLVTDFQWILLSPTYSAGNDLSVSISSAAEWLVFCEIFVDRDYDAAISLALDNPARHGYRILDLGAHAGFFALRAAELGRPGALRQPLTIIAIEGVPAVFRRLQHNLRGGVLSAGIKVDIVHGLVGARSGRGLIYATRHTASNMVARGRTSGFPFRASYAIAVDYVDVEKVAGPGVIDLVKCDIEGSEEDFVTHYEPLLCRTRFLVIEFHPLLCDVGKCRSLLAAYGFSHLLTVRQTAVVSLEVFRGIS